MVSDIRGSSRPSLVYVVGASDRGKTTFCRHLLEALGRYGPAAYIDCDPGQSSIGPPGTIGMQMVPGGFPETLFFTGSLSPRGHLLQTMCGIKKLSDKAQALGARRVVLDSSGFVSGHVAREFQYHVIDLLGPAFLVAIQEHGEVEEILGNFSLRSGTAIHRLPVSPAVRPRSSSERREYRTERFRKHFQGAVITEVPLEGKGLHGDIPDFRRPGELDGLLTGLCDGDGFLAALGAIRAFDGDRGVLEIFAPTFETSRVSTLQFGSYELDARDFSTRFKHYGR